jgi:hypothetical protein
MRIARCAVRALICGLLLCPVVSPPHADLGAGDGGPNSASSYAGDGDSVGGGAYAGPQGGTVGVVPNGQGFGHLLSPAAGEVWTRVFTFALVRAPAFAFLPFTCLHHRCHRSLYTGHSFPWGFHSSAPFHLSAFLLLRMIVSKLVLPSILIPSCCRVSWPLSAGERGRRPR